MLAVAPLKVPETPAVVVPGFEVAFVLAAGVAVFVGVLASPVVGEVPNCGGVIAKTAPVPPISPAEINSARFISPIIRGFSDFFSANVVRALIVW